MQPHDDCLVLFRGSLWFRQKIKFVCCFFDSWFFSDRNLFFLIFLFSLFEAPSELELNYGEPSASPYIFEGVLGLYANFASNILRSAYRPGTGRASPLVWRILTHRKRTASRPCARTTSCGACSSWMSPDLSEKSKFAGSNVVYVALGCCNNIDGKRGQLVMMSLKQLCLTFPIGIYVIRVMKNGI